MAAVAVMHRSTDHEHCLGLLNLLQALCTTV
jgi:hypothetical protein